MLEAIRKHSKFVMIFLFVLIIPSFIFVGMDQGYFMQNSPTVAKVDGADITQLDWDNTHRSRSDELRRTNPTLDAAALDDPAARYAVLEAMVREHTTVAAARHMRISVPDAAVAAAIADLPGMDSVRKDGKLDMDAYRALLAGRGMTPAQFESLVRSELALDAVTAAFTGGQSAPAAAAQPSLDALLAQREIQIVQLPASGFASKVEVSEDKLHSYYNAHAAQFQQPERADIEYLVLDMDSVRRSITLPEDDVRSYWRENGARIAGAQEQRRASHILIAAATDAPAAERQAARERAQALRDQLVAKPADFAKLAREHSQDPGSAAQGGDLGFFARGAMVEPFEKAAFSLQEGDISEVIETEFGYHILRLSAIKTPVVPSFESMRADIERTLREEQAQRKFAEVAETFSNLVYEQPDSLTPAAQALGLSVQTARDLSPTPTPTLAAPLNNPRLLEAIFAHDSVASKRNTAAIEVGTQQLVAARVTAHQAQRQSSFEEVKDRVRSAFVAEQAAVLAEQDGKAKLQAWSADTSQFPRSPATIVGRHLTTPDAPAAIINAALLARADALPTVQGVSLGAQGYALIKINRSVPLKAEQAQQMQAQLQRQYQAVWAAADLKAYERSLAQRFGARIEVPRPTANALTAQP